MSPQVLSRYETAIRQANPLSALRAAATVRLARGSRDAVLAELEELRLLPQVVTNQDLEDVVLEVMDAVSGYSSPLSKLR
ncbi:MAG: hypothetical protein ACYDGR_04800 [Candidatus Dormibacteria bacterium]